MKKLISLLLILGLATSFTACSILEDLAETMQTDSAADENNSEDETEPQTQGKQLNEKESTKTATIDEGTFTITEELGETTYEFHHPELENIFKNRDGVVEIYYMLEGDEGGWYSTGNYHSVPFLIQADFDEEDFKFQAIMHNGETDEVDSVDRVFEDNTIKLTFTESDYKPAEYEFILISMSTDENNFYYEGHFTDDVFKGNSVENTNTGYFESKEKLYALLESNIGQDIQWSAQTATLIPLDTETGFEKEVIETPITMFTTYDGNGLSVQIYSESENLYIIEENSGYLEGGHGHSEGDYEFIGGYDDGNSSIKIIPENDSLIVIIEFRYTVDGLPYNYVIQIPFTQS